MCVFSDAGLFTSVLYFFTFVSPSMCSVWYYLIRCIVYAACGVVFACVNRTDWSGFQAWFVRVSYVFADWFVG